MGGGILGVRKGGRLPRITITERIVVDGLLRVNAHVFGGGTTAV